MKKKIIISFLLVLLSIPSIQGQTDINQNGIKTTVINSLAANATQAKRYEIATVGYNSYHWQPGGIIMVELFENYYETGYEKYIIENGFGQGANSGCPLVKLVESCGHGHNAKVTLGTAYDLSTNYGGFVNKALPIYVDVRYYGQYKARITYLHDKVTELSWSNQIKIDDNPTSTDIPDFSVSTEITSNSDINSTGNLRITGTGNHFIQSGNVGIGTTNPGSKLVITEGNNGMSINSGDVSGLGFNRNVSDGAIYNPNLSGWQFSARDERFSLEGYNGATHVLLNVLKNGNIGIGSQNPDQKLTVKGKIHAEEVIVDLAVPADYVFKSTYKLMPLPQVEQFVKTNSHLPEIPSAKEITKNGLSVGEMQNKLLQKVEELTLYAIEMKKEINVLKEENKRIRTQLDRK